MDSKIPKALYVVLISLGLALLFNFLFFEKLVGISAFIFVSALLAVISLLGIHQKLPLKKTWWLILLIIFFSTMLGVRANEFLIFLNICAILGLLMLLSNELAGKPTFLMRLWDYVILMVLVPFRMLVQALSTLSLASQIHSRVGHRDAWIRVIKGVIMAVPILIIFGSLFSQADLAFSKFIKGFVDINISERSIQYLVLLLFAFVSALSFLSYIFSPKREPVFLDKQVEATVDHGKGIEVMVFLGLISSLFLVFIGFQITYLFGGETNIINAGFTYAEYARRGFWELLAVAMLSLLVLLASEKYAGNRAQAEQQPGEYSSGAVVVWPSSYDEVESKKDRRFMIPALILIGEVVIVICSAFKRLSLYIDAYGMTIQRFYVAGFIVLLLVLFILLAIKFINSKREQFFFFGTLLSVASFLIVVNLVNPDAVIIKSNIDRYNRTGKIDPSYVRELSADATPWKIELYNELEGEDRAVIREWLEKEKANLEKSSGDWRSANLSRSRARKLLQEY